MNFFPLFLARRLLSSLPNKQTLSRASRVCFFSIMLGAIALTLTAALMNGLRQSTYATLQNIHPDIIMHDFNHMPLAFEKINHVLLNEFGNDIQAVAPFGEQQGVIQGLNNQDITHIMTIQGIDPTNDNNVRSWSKTLIKPLATSTLKHLLINNNVIIGKGLAETLALTVGKTVEMLFPTRVNHLTRSIHFKQHKGTVVGIFSTGIDELDSTLVITSLTFFAELFPQTGITSIGLKKTSSAITAPLVTRLKKRFNLDVYGWQELYPALEAALDLETTAFIIIIMLVMLIANMNIMSLLTLFVTEKKHTLAILQSMGISQGVIKKSLLLIGCGITTSAQLSGILGGWLLSMIIDRFKLIPLPDLYYAPYLTAHLTPTTALSIFVIGTGVGVFTAWWSLAALQKTTIPLALKKE